MKLFLWVMLVLLATTCVGKLLGLARGRLEPRTPANEAVDVAINAALLVWIAVLLNGL